VISEVTGVPYDADGLLPSDLGFLDTEEERQKREARLREVNRFDETTGTRDACAPGGTR
jgi:hypothetical protein